MKRTLGRPTYAFEARQYVVSVCVKDMKWVQVPGRKPEWILNVCGRVCLVKPCTTQTVASLIIRCATHSVSTRRLFVTINEAKHFLTKEAGVCVWLSIDHMALTHVETRRMIGEDDDFIPHHMYQLQVSCRSPCPAAVSELPHRASPRGQFTKCHKHLRMWRNTGKRMPFIPPSNHPSPLFKSHSEVDVTFSEVLVTLWIVSRIHPSRASIVLAYHTAAVLSVCKDHNIPVYLCLSEWLERV